MAIVESIALGKPERRSVPTSSSEVERYDVAVIGSGFGGLGAALSLAERGYRVAIFETLKYPGGCAGTFTRKSYRFEAGATLSSGFGERQLFRQWIDRYQLGIDLEYLSPAIHFRAPELSLDIPSDHQGLVDLFAQLPDAPSKAIRAFFAHQKRVSDSLWRLFDDPELLPPWNARSLMKLAARSPSYLPMLRDVNRSLLTVLARYGLDRFQPLKLYLDALCQITVQGSAAEVEAPFALSTMDYYGRGTAHVVGGIGKLAEGLCEGIERLGGDVRLLDQVREARALDEGGFEITSRKGVSRARFVISNLLPAVTERLFPHQDRWPDWSGRLQRAVEDGWSAGMLYLVAESPEAASGEAEHWQLVHDADKPMREGNHIFCSISSERELDRAPAGSRTLTVSTHIPAAEMRKRNPREQGRYVKMIQRQMRETLSVRCPEWSDGVYFGMTASPRTFERFTGRPEGLVGGAPRKRGWRHYLDLGPRQLMPGLYLVGDSVFPGQSTLATATGGARVAEHLHRRAQRSSLPAPSRRVSTLSANLTPLKSPPPQ